MDNRFYGGRKNPAMDKKAVLRQAVRAFCGSDEAAEELIRIHSREFRSEAAKPAAPPGPSALEWQEATDRLVHGTPAEKERARKTLGIPGLVREATDEVLAEIAAENAATGKAAQLDALDAQISDLSGIWQRALLNFEHGEAAKMKAELRALRAERTALESSR